jgi:hypothetical protein
MGQQVAMMMMMMMMMMMRMMMMMMMMTITCGSLSYIQECYVNGNTTRATVLY